MNCRCSSRNKIINGSVVNAVAAASPGMSVPSAELKPARPTSTGWTPAPDEALLVITSGHRKLFQLATSVAGWYTGSSRPGATGPAVIDGHIDSYAGPGIFFRLIDLHRGNRIYVRRADGTLAVSAALVTG
jgi:hypothetical protein